MTAARSAAAIERRLATACELIQALLEETTPSRSPSSFAEGRERGRRARGLLHYADLPHAVFLASGEVRFVNHAWRALFRQLDPKQKVTLPCAADAALSRVLSTGEPEYLAEVAFRIGSRPGYCSILFRPRDRPGLSRDVIAVCIDTTDRVLAQQLGVPADALLWSGELCGVADHFSEAWTAHTGRTRPQSWLDAVHPDDRARCSQACAEATRLREPIEIEARLLGVDGDQRWHELRFVSPGCEPRWYASAVDIHAARAVKAEFVSRERAARADAELANQLKDRFLAAVSHELRAPLTTMLLWEKVLRDETADAEIRTQALDAIRQSAQAQSRLVGDLLDVSRAISGKLHVDSRPADITSIVEDALRAIEPMMEAKGIALEARLDPALGAVKGDATRLRQVFDNLLSNALKFTERGGRVSVTTRRRGRVITVVVVDSGRGIAKELLSRLFQPFTQADDVLTRTQGGLGLGLAIARQLVVLHHGTLEATSAGAGRGATFTVTLPASDRRRVQTPTVGARTLALDGMRILAVDDDPLVRDGLARLLKRHGATAETAANAAQGREMIAAAAPCIVLCDIAMPHEDGYEFISKLRAAGNATPAIALTAHVAPANAQRALAAGFDLHVAKPIVLEDLVACIHDLVMARAARNT